MSMLATSILALLWLAFLAYWLISARTAKRNVRSSHSWAVARLLLVLVLVALLHWVPAFRRLAHTRVTSPASIVAGFVLCALGFGLAVWARVHLGRNWGQPMSVKERPELVTGGPYRSVRHPIYTGILLAILGSALVAGTVWLLVFVFAGAYFVFAARREEHTMARQFPRQYPEYRRRTRAFIPFLW